MKAAGSDQDHKKENLNSMQSLRNLKFKRYPFWSIDKLNLQIIKGGWHFSFLQSPDQILKKINLTHMVNSMIVV